MDLKSVYHLGHNVGAIMGMPFDGVYFKDFSDLIKQIPFKYVTAITADSGQKWE